MGHVSIILSAVNQPDQEKREFFSLFKAMQRDSTKAVEIREDIINQWVPWGLS